MGQGTGHVACKNAMRVRSPAKDEPVRVACARILLPARAAPCSERPAMARAKKYWLMKCEPAAYTIDDLARDGVTGWEGVRNYQARNTLRDEMKTGDGVLFYASNADPSGVVGLAEIAREGYPDPLAFRKGHAYHDPKSKPDEPTWYAVDVRFVEKFADVVSLDDLRAQRSLAQMMVLQKGSRLSIQPVTRAQYDAVVKLGRAREPRTAEPRPRRRSRP